MAGMQPKAEWLDGFLFVGNQLALDFLNTKPILGDEPRELLPNAAALERWLVAAGVVTSPRAKRLIRAWSNTRAGDLFVQRLIAYRERLRAAVLRLEAGSGPGSAFLSEVNLLLKRYPQRMALAAKGSKIVSQPLIAPRKPEDVWAPIMAATSELLSNIEPERIRKCDSAECVVHFYDISRKGSRRWCSMNLCGNRLKVAAYQRRRRLA